VRLNLGVMNAQIKTGLMSEFPDFGSRHFNVEVYNQRFREQNVIIHARARSVSFPKHWGGLSIKTVVRGTEHYQADNARYAVDEQTYLVFNEGRYYSSWIDAEHEVESFTLNFSEAFAQQVIASVTANAEQMLDASDKVLATFRFTEMLYPADNLITPVVHSMRALCAEVESNQAALHAHFVSLLERLVQVQINTNKTIEAIDKTKRSTRVELYNRLSRAKDFIYSCHAQPLTLAEIANVACLNQYYFLRQFKKAFQVSPHQLLLQRRLSVAADLLKAGKGSVSDIGTAVGFHDAASFSKLFKKAFGVAPQRFRNSQGGATG